MEWKPVVEGAIGAIFGGTVTGVAAYIGLGRAVTKLTATMEMMQKNCQRCTDHIDCDDKHITADMRERVDRLEGRMNGHLDGLKAKAGAK